MQFIVRMDAKPTDILMYAFSRICELWPKAVGVVLDAPNGPEYFEKALASLSFSGNDLLVYPDADRRLAADLLGARVPSLQIMVQKDTVSAWASPDARQPLEHLARLPLWQHKVDSSRLQVA